MLLFHMFIEITLLAYIIDKFFCKSGFASLHGKFNFIKHPVIYMGDYIKWFESRFYKDSFINGTFLTLTLLLIVFIITYTLAQVLPWYILGILASFGIASSMLYSSVKDIIDSPKNIKYLVSRDTSELSNSDINKAAIETYAENLSDGVIAPLFYLLLFGIVGLFVYKAINTLDSMVGYKNDKYSNFGKFSAKLDDVVNFLPARITAILIALLFFSKKSFANIFKYGSLHESPNAGYPISAMAGVCNISLGGDTKYFGKVKAKPYFGDGTKEITTDHILKALSFQVKLNSFIIVFLITLILLTFSS